MSKKVDPNLRFIEINNYNYKTIIAPERIGVLYSLAVMYKHIEGDVVEVGVYKGGSLQIIADVMYHKKCFGFDTFEGIPYRSEHDNFHKVGDFKDVTIESVRSDLKDTKNIELIKGVITKELFNNTLGDSKLSFVHVDADVYDSGKICCEELYPRLVSGGVIIFDDYGVDTCKGIKIACDEFFKDKNDLIFKPDNLHMIVIKK